MAMLNNQMVTKWTVHDFCDRWAGKPPSLYNYHEDITGYHEAILSAEVSQLLFYKAQHLVRHIYHRPPKKNLVVELGSWNPSMDLLYLMT